MVEWGEKWLSFFNSEKCKTLHLDTMTLMLFLTVVLYVTSLASSESSDGDVMSLKFDSTYPEGDARWCIDRGRKSNIEVTRLAVLPGIGWDNLRNLEAGIVADFNFMQCKVTDDGRRLIPDSVYTVPLKTSRLNTFAEIISSWKNTSSITSYSINLDAGVKSTKGGISGSFSMENAELKTTQVHEKSVTVRVQFRYDRYEVKLLPTFQLSPGFKRKLMNIAADIWMNNTEQAIYNAQLLIRDYGTHYLTSVTAGAAMGKDDYLKKTVFRNEENEIRNLKLAASFSYMDKFHMSASFGHGKTSDIKTSYLNKVTNSHIWSHGGPMIGAKPSMDDWLAGVDTNLVPIDKAGEPLNVLVTKEILPELPVMIIDSLAEIVRKSIQLYYDINTIAGCTDTDGENFSFSANFEDSTCIESAKDLLYFGGVYQTCETYGRYKTDPCSENMKDNFNPKTGRLSCPKNFMGVKLGSFKNTKNWKEKVCSKTVKVFTDNFFVKLINKVSCMLVDCCKYSQHRYDVLYTAYWCASLEPVQPNSGYLFGGVFSKTRVNPWTGAYTCPYGHIIRLLLTDLSICMSDSFSLKLDSVSLGGFFSCRYGNPLANDVQQKYSEWGEFDKRCPKGYSQRLAVIHNGCSIYYCIQTSKQNLTEPIMPRATRPPFEEAPFAPRVADDDQITFVQALMKKETEGEFYNLLVSKLYATIPEEEKMDSKSLSGFAIACISAGVILFCYAIIVVIAACSVKRNRKQRADIEMPEHSLETLPASAVKPEPRHLCCSRSRKQRADIEMPEHPLETLQASAVDSVEPERGNFCCSRSRSRSLCIDDCPPSDVN